MKLLPVDALQALLDKELAACVKCGNCMAFCPLFRAEPREVNNMRGKLALLQIQNLGVPIPRDDLFGAFDLCLGCQTCKLTCPNKVNTPLAVMLGRFLAAAAPCSTPQSVAVPCSAPQPKDGLEIPKQPRFQEKVTNDLACRPAKNKPPRGSTGNDDKFVDQPVDVLVLTDDCGDLSREKRERLRSLLARAGVAGEVLSVSELLGQTALAEQMTLPEHAGLQGQTERSPQSELPEPSELARQAELPEQTGLPGQAEPSRRAELLEQVEIPGSSGPGSFEASADCGWSCLKSGDAAAAVLRANGLLARLRSRSWKKIIIWNASCLYALRLCADISETTPEEKALLASLVDAPSFLAGISWPVPKKLPGRFTWHDPCLLLRGLGIKAPPRSLLRQVAETVIESSYEGACCGYGNGFAERQPELGTRVRDVRMNHLLHVTPDVVVTACDECVRMLAEPLARTDIEVVDLLEVLWAAMTDGRLPGTSERARTKA